MDQPRVQVLEEVHVAGVEAGVVVEVISGGDGERDIRQLHGSVPNTPKKKNNPVPETEKSEKPQTSNVQDRNVRGANMGRGAGSEVSGECRVLSQTVLSCQLLTWIILYLGHQPREGSGP